MGKRKNPYTPKSFESTGEARDTFANIYESMLCSAAYQDLTKNLLTCSGYYVRAAIIRYSENCCTSVRVPIYLKERIRKYAKYRQQCMNEKGRYPTRDELLEVLDISARSLDHLEKTLYNLKTY